VTNQQVDDDDDDDDATNDEERLSVRQISSKIRSNNGNP
jgi:hypothetical protein